MHVALTEEQLHVLDTAGPIPVVVDPRTRDAYALVPVEKYLDLIATEEQRREQRAIDAVALRCAMSAMDEIP